MRICLLPLSLIQCEYETAPIEQRLQSIPCMSEPGRKLFAYDSVCRGPGDWGAIKRHKAQPPYQAQR